MTELPLKFLDWLKTRADNRAVALSGYIKSVNFRPADKIQLTRLFVCVDEYIENYSDNSKQLAGNYYPVPAYDLLDEIWGYECDGVLLWIPALSKFGSFDSDHGVLRTRNGDRSSLPLFGSSRASHR